MARRLKFLKRTIAVMALVAISGACKPPKQNASNLQSLENFASQRTLHLNHCEGTAAEKASATTEAVVATAGRTLAKPVVDALRDAVSAVPAEVRQTFLATGSRLKVTPDPREACAPLVKNQPANEEIAGCFVRANPKDLDDDAIHIVVRDSPSAIHHELVRQFGYAYFQYFRLLRTAPTADSPRLNYVARGFFSDVVFSPFFSLKALKPLLGLGGAEHLAVAVKLGASDPLGSLELSAEGKYQLVSYVLGEAFDSYFCNASAPFDPSAVAALQGQDQPGSKQLFKKLKAALAETKNSRALMGLLFPSTYSRFARFAKENWPSTTASATVKGAATLRAHGFSLDDEAPAEETCTDEVDDSLSAESLFGDAAPNAQLEDLGIDRQAASDETDVSDDPPLSSLQGQAAGLDAADLLATPASDLASQDSAAPRDDASQLDLANASQLVALGLPPDATQNLDQGANGYSLGIVSAVKGAFKKCFGAASEVEAHSASKLNRLEGGGLSTWQKAAAKRPKSGSDIRLEMQRHIEASRQRGVEALTTRAQEPAVNRALRGYGIDTQNLDPEQVIAAGGYGVVVKTPDGHVLKVPKNAEVAKAQIDESLLLASLQNEPTLKGGIGEVFDYDPATGIVRQPYLGESLASALTAGRLDSRESKRILDEVSVTTQELHRYGLAHNDIKPENVMLREGPDGKLHPKLIDFGSARQPGEVGMPFSSRYMPHVSLVPAAQQGRLQGVSAYGNDIFAIDMMARDLNLPNYRSPLLNAGDSWENYRPLPLYPQAVRYQPRH